MKPINSKTLNKIIWITVGLIFAITGIICFSLTLVLNSSMALFVGLILWSSYLISLGVGYGIYMFYKWNKQHKKIGLKQMFSKKTRRMSLYVFIVLMILMMLISFNLLIFLCINWSSEDFVKEMIAYADSQAWNWKAFNYNDLTTTYGLTPAIVAELGIKQQNAVAWLFNNPTLTINDWLTQGPQMWWGYVNYNTYLLHEVTIWLDLIYSAFIIAVIGILFFYQQGTLSSK